MATALLAAPLQVHLPAATALRVAVPLQVHRRAAMGPLVAMGLPADLRLAGLPADLRAAALPVTVGLPVTVDLPATVAPRALLRAALAVPLPGTAVTSRPQRAADAPR